MKLTTRSRYGIRMMLDIAKNGEQSPVSVKDISNRQDISLKYLEKLTRSLRKAGYIKSKLGAKGGYMLAKEPENISVGEIVQTLEGNIDLVNCMLKGEACPRMETCSATKVWGELNQTIHEKLNSISIADLIQEGSYCHEPSLGN